MTKLGDLHPAPGSNRKSKRLGRGIGSGKGKTAGKGHKGQRSRSGAKRRAWFEGGQMPLQRRVPKFGFTNLFRREYQIINLHQLSQFKSGENVTLAVLMGARLIKKNKIPVKILGSGELGHALEIEAHAFSSSAEAKITGAGGKVIKV